MTILYGLLIAIAIVSICFLILLEFNNVGYCIVSVIVGVALMIFLTFENSRLIKDFQQRNKVDDIMVWVEKSLATANVIMPDNVQSYTFGPIEAYGIVAAVKSFDSYNHSSYADYIDASDFTGKSWASVSDTLQRVIKKESSKKIGFRIGWCVLAVVAAMGIIIVIGKRNYNSEDNLSIYGSGDDLSGYSSEDDLSGYSYEYE